MSVSTTTGSTPALILLSFFAAGASALAFGFEAAAAVEPPVLVSEDPDLLLLAGYSYETSSDPCGEVLPFGLVVPEAHSTVVKCVVIENRSTKIVTGLRLLDPDVGDGPFLVESIEAGEQLTISTRVDNDGDLVARTTLTASDPVITLKVESRTFTVQGGAILGAVDPGGEDSVVVLSGRTQSGQRQDLTTVIGGDGQFEFDDLPPSDESGYWLTYDESPVVVAPVILLDGDQVNVTNEPLLPSAVLESSEAADLPPEPLIVPAPEVLAFEPIPERSAFPVAMLLLLICGLIVALAIPVRRAAPART